MRPLAFLALLLVPVPFVPAADACTVVYPDDVPACVGAPPPTCAVACSITLSVSQGGRCDADLECRHVIQLEAASKGWIETPILTCSSDVPVVHASHDGPHACLLVVEQGPADPFCSTYTLTVTAVGHRTGHTFTDTLLWPTC